MRSRNLNFSTRTLSVAADSPLRDLAAPQGGVEMAGPQVLTLRTPDLSGYATAREKAHILLDAAAEVEHALMVEYLYAAYSLRAPGGGETAAQGTALVRWVRTIVTVAKEEMGHLLTVENLLVALGLPPNLEREDFPFRSDLYPFRFHLEPLSRLSLAKYVMAESPTVPPAGTEAVFAEIAALLAGSMVEVNHVATLYAYVGLVFAPAEGLPEIIDAEADPARRRYLEIVQALGAEVVPAGEEAAWHLGAGEYTGAAAAQADADDWRSDAGPDGAGPKVLKATDAQSALLALAVIAVQGEGPGNTVEGDSHFVRFLNIFRGTGTLPAFPLPDDAWQPARPVPRDPRLPEDVVAEGTLIEDPLAQAWCRVANGSYGVLLGLIEYYLRSERADRWVYADAAFVQMTERLRTVREALGELPPATAGPVEAGVPFKLPAGAINLPAEAGARRAAMQARYAETMGALEALRAALLAGGVGDGVIAGWREAYQAEHDAL